MDRDNRAERTDRAVAAILDGVGEAARRSGRRGAASYARGITDEFIEPIVFPAARASILRPTPRSSSTSGPTAAVSSRAGCSSAAST